MMNDPKVSIIVPVYNVEKYLPQCMESLLNQTLKEVEIILVDDESPDNCPAMCDAYAKRDDRVRVIHKKNDGPAFARNSGIEIAKGEYLAFVDSDDYLELNAYMKAYSIVEHTKEDAVYFSCHRIDNDGKIWEMTNICNQTRYHAGEDIRRLMLEMIANLPKAKRDGDTHPSVWSGLYRSELIKRHGLAFRKGIISDDRLFNLDFLLHATRAITIPDALYFWRFNPGSLSHAVNPDVMDKSYYFYQSLLAFLNENNFGREGYLRATRLFIAVARVGIRQYVHAPLPKSEKMLWLSMISKHSFWKEIASAYPYRQLPLKYAIHFHLIYRRHCRLLYYYSKLNYRQR